MAEENNKFISDFDLLAKHGIVGLFDHFELIEIIRYKETSAQPKNLFTIAVAVENAPPRSATFLNDKPIRLRNLKGHNFGIYKSIHSTTKIRSKINTILSSGNWNPNGKRIKVDNLVPVTKQFVPPNPLEEIPLNRVLKNNFFAGSYVLELFDIKKSMHTDFEQNPVALQELSEKISELIPIHIGSLSDRLGNIVFQFPINAIRASFRTNGIHYSAEVAWHPKVEPREVIVTAQTNYDKTVVSFGQALIKSGTIKLSEDPDHGMLCGYVWDNENKILLAATGQSSFIKTISMGMNPINPEPRMIPQNIEDVTAKVRLKLSSQPMNNVIGKNFNESISRPISRRTYDEERATLAARKQFVQYGANGTWERDKALQDLRGLISAYGKQAVWLWDPYLEPQGLLDSLFHNPTSNAEMLALTALKTYNEEPPSQSNPLKSSGSLKGLRVLNCLPYKYINRDDHRTKNELIKSYRKTLSNLPGNYLGLHIEFRSAHGMHGWKFHDRFLIFPRSEHEAAKAWSLGVSINGLGKSHHILQQVDNAQLIADAFQLLWSKVRHPDNLIWKYP